MKGVYVLLLGVLLAKAVHSEEAAEVPVDEAIKHAKDEVKENLKKEANEANRQKGGKKDGSFSKLQEFHKTKPFSRELGLSGFVLSRATQELINLGIDCKTLRELGSPLRGNKHRLSPDDPFPQPEAGTCPWPPYRCPKSNYRSHDGSCNNLANPLWGRAFTPFKRYLHPVYDNELSSIRKTENGDPLPSARLVSSSINIDNDMPDHIHTHMIMVFGQFLDHDITLTPLSKLVTSPSGGGETVDVDCSSLGCDTDHEACLPIPVPDNDPVFPPTKDCLDFVRSQPVPNLHCKFGPREQLNQITSFIDGSNVYGSSVEDTNEIRDLENSERGKMKTIPHPLSELDKPLLPTEEEEGCEVTNNPPCFNMFKAGDVRANEQPTLTVMHTMWVREHNRIEAQLHEINPKWDGEKLFQETRRIVGAMLQVIAYKEFLPAVLGADIMKEYDLEVKQDGYFTEYDKTIDPRIANAFAAASYRFGHSLIQRQFKRADANFDKDTYPAIDLSSAFFNPANVYSVDNGGIDALTRGLFCQKAQAVDQFFTDQVSSKLFPDEPNGLGTDIVALNIQRGRDHGIPGYNAWRSFCGLQWAEDFDDLSAEIDASKIQNLAEVYDHVDDIDLFVGGLMENPVPGGIVGPTFACMNAQQFRDLKFGDRFWHELGKIPGQNIRNPFKEDQLAEIRKASLARVLCDNSDNISEIQPLVMQLPIREAYPNKDFSHITDSESQDYYNNLWDEDFNARVFCDELPQMDLTAWGKRKKKQK